MALVLALVHQICDSILACEEAALTREEIVEIREPVRRIHARSPFVARLQQWPRGYPGDFETVEYLCSVCGSCPDLRSIADHLPPLAGEIWLNDGDPAVLEFSATALRSVRERWPC